MSKRRRKERDGGEEWETHTSSRRGGATYYALPSLGLTQWVPPPPLTDPVGAHYDAITAKSRTTEREASVSYNVRAYNNWFTGAQCSAMLSTCVPPAERMGLRVLDVAGGKGGSGAKWSRLPSCGVTHLSLCDVSATSVSEGVRRLKTIPAYKRAKVDGVVLDLLDARAIRAWHPGAAPAHVATLLFAVNYLCATEAQLVAVLETVRSHVRVGAPLLITYLNTDNVGVGRDLHGELFDLVWLIDEEVAGGAGGGGGGVGSGGGGAGSGGGGAGSGGGGAEEVSAGGATEKGVSVPTRPAYRFTLRGDCVDGAVEYTLTPDVLEACAAAAGWMVDVADASIIHAGRDAAAPAADATPPPPLLDAERQVCELYGWARLRAVGGKSNGASGYARVR